MPNTLTRVASAAEQLQEAENAVAVQRAHVEELDAAAQAATIQAEDAEDAVRRAMAVATTRHDTLDALRERSEGAERRNQAAQDALAYAQEELRRLVENRDRLKAATADERHDAAVAELNASADELNGRMQRALDALLPDIERFEALQRVAVQAYSDREHAHRRTARNFAPFIDALSRRIPGFLNRVGAVAQLARFGGLPQMPIVREPEPTTEAQRRLRY